MSQAASLTDRVNAQRKSRLVRILVACGVAVVLIAAGIVAWFSPVLALSHVNVKGATLTDSRQVSDSVMRSWQGTPLPQIRLGALGDSLHRQFPKTHEVKVRWSGPQSLQVTVTDRVPVIAMEASGKWQRYDADGELIDTVDSKPQGIAQLSGATSNSSPALKAAVHMLNELPADARGNVVSMQATSVDDLRVVYSVAGETPNPSAKDKKAEKSKEVEIRFGDSTNIAEKFESARVLLKLTPGYIDVSVPSMPTTGR